MTIRPPDQCRDAQRAKVADTRYNADGTVFLQTLVQWNYDNMGRLTDETLTVQAGGSNAPAAYDDQFQYDQNSNRTSETITGGTTGNGNITYTYNGDDQLGNETGTFTNAAGNYSTAYTYDANGNLQTQTRTGNAAETDVYGYDLRKRMTSSTATVGGTASVAAYAYDPNGVLVSQTTNAGTSGATTTTYLNDPLNPTGYSKAIQQTTVAGGTSTSTSYVLGLKVEAQADAANGTLYLLADGHGSTRALVNATGGVVQTFDYDAFGTALDFNAASAKTTWLFGGDGFYDPSTGWTYHLARWTNGFWFTQADSFSGSNSDPTSLHKYLYAGDNPVNCSDPTGHLDLCDLGMAIGLGALISSVAWWGGIRTYETVTHWNGIAGSQSQSGGQGGYDVTQQLISLRRDALATWPTEPGAQQDSQLYYLGLNWSKPWSPLASWDIREFYSQQELISPIGTAYGTVTVNGRVYWQDEVNYYWYGVVTRLSDMRQQALTGLSTNTVDSACTRIAAYRGVFWGATLVAGRQAWFKAGYYGDFSYAQGQNLTQFTPSGPYSSSLDGWFGENSSSSVNTTFIAVGMPW